MPNQPRLPVPGTGATLALLMQWLRRLDLLSFWAIVVCMGLMATLVSGQVFFRYILSSSIDSADELSRLFFVWAMFLAIPHGVKSGIHIGIDALVRHFNENIRHQLSRLMSLASAILMGLVFVVTISVVEDKWQELMPTMNMTAAVYYIAVLIASGHAFLHLLVLAWGGPLVWQEAEA